MAAGNNSIAIVLEFEKTEGNILHFIRKPAQYEVKAGSPFEKGFRLIVEKAHTKVLVPELIKGQLYIVLGSLATYQHPQQNVRNYFKILATAFAGPVQQGFDMNHVQLAGRAGSDDYRRINYFYGGSVVCNGSIAVDNPRDKENTIWVNLEVWNKSATVFADYATSGTPISVAGSLVPENYTNRNGDQVYQLKVKLNPAFGLTLMGKAHRQEEAAPASISAPTSAPTPVVAAATNGNGSTPPLAGEGDTDYDDIPF